jgi:hypothetical protein
MGHPMPRPANAIALFALLLLLTVAFAACGEREEPVITTQDEPQFVITGRWAGELTQKGRKPFEVEAAIVSLERSKQNIVRYTGINCSGTWEYLGATTTAYRFRELIDRGESKQCKGTGTVELTPVTNDSVKYVFRGGGVTSRGVLDRQAPGQGGGQAGQGSGGQGSGEPSG